MNQGRLWVGLHPSLWHLVEVVWPGLLLTQSHFALLLTRPESDGGCGSLS